MTRSILNNSPTSDGRVDLTRVTLTRQLELLFYKLELTRVGTRRVEPYTSFIRTSDGRDELLSQRVKSS